MVTPATPAYELRIELDAIEPPIWRTFLVPADISLDELHVVIQVVMGWTNSHLHEFERDGRRFGPSNPDFASFGDPAEDEAEYRLQNLLKRPKQRLTYMYDFGDGWSHTVALVAIHHDSEAQLRCLDGKRACPPDDCGGPYGYMELLEILKKRRKSRDDRERLDWFRSMTPKDHDPEVFPIAEVNEEFAVGLDALVEEFQAAEDEDWE